MGWVPSPSLYPNLAPLSPETWRAFGESGLGGEGSGVRGLGFAACVDCLDDSLPHANRITNDIVSGDPQHFVSPLPQTPVACPISVNVLNGEMRSATELNCR